MTDVDDWYDDEPFGYWAKEEPTCTACGDSGYTGRWRCPSCNPTRVQALWWRLTWWARWWRIRAWFRFRRSASTDEAPF